jgi:hypothetical protein
MTVLNATGACRLTGGSQRCCSPKSCPPVWKTVQQPSPKLRTLGAQSTDLVLLVMNTRGVEALLTTKVQLGANMSAAAGPKGRDTGASTEASLRAEMLSYESVIKRADVTDLAGLAGAPGFSAGSISGGRWQPRRKSSFSRSLNSHEIGQPCSTTAPLSPRPNQCGSW